MIFTFHCDVSFDGTANVKGIPHVPRTYVFAGFFADDQTCNEIGEAWSRVNIKYEVPRFHAAHLNSKSNEYTGWDDLKKKAYSAELLDILKIQGKRVHGISCGMYADEYEKIISSEGRRKLGSPYLACFNSCVALVAKSMNAPGAFKEDACFSVVLDQDRGYQQAIDSFFAMKANLSFEHRNRLGTCSASTMEGSICLQAADLIAYEVFKRLHSHRRGNVSPRYPLQAMMRDNVVDEQYFGAKTFEQLKDRIESTSISVPDGRLVVIPTPRGDVT